MPVGPRHGRGWMNFLRLVGLWLKANVVPRNSASAPPAMAVVLRKSLLVCIVYIGCGFLPPPKTLAEHPAQHERPGKRNSHPQLQTEVESVFSDIFWLSLSETCRGFRRVTTQRLAARTSSHIRTNALE